ncbi:hypothetical protein [Pseudonocardia parietis]|uniref:Uncharacterized protein n=1 Tax=Pseudonocardia parietis TaxID=570936 RepID=A0ABS4W092_9PSEU|nr:hypothetical protein [Pseudonocardia parietis]MBP2369595.1 hypothetical protein [Pseudonocardia parietis]
MKLGAQVADGARVVTTADLYRQRMRSVILSAIGQWRLHECTVSRFDGFSALLMLRHSAESRESRPQTAICCSTPESTSRDQNVPTAGRVGFLVRPPGPKAITVHRLAPSETAGETSTATIR